MIVGMKCNSHARTAELAFAEVSDGSMNMTDFGKKCIAQVSLLGCLGSYIAEVRTILSN